MVVDKGRSSAPSTGRIGGATRRARSQIAEQLARFDLEPLEQELQANAQRLVDQGFRLSDKTERGAYEPADNTVPVDQRRRVEIGDVMTRLVATALTIDICQQADQLHCEINAARARLDNKLNQLPHRDELLRTAEPIKASQGFSRLRYAGKRLARIDTTVAAYKARSNALAAMAGRQIEGPKGKKG